MSEGTQRRLAAIVSADVVGYSRLMGVSELGTLRALRGHRTELFDPLIDDHGGRVVKTMGDGLLLEFPSVVEAVACALAVQEGMAQRNEDIPDDKRLVFRIGVNLGDIIIEGEDILGDGVNIAARLQEIAAPGGICISRRVYEDVEDRLEAAFEDRGEATLKNIARPVRVWHWSPGGSTAPTAEAASTPALPDMPSLAVLPFDNMSGDAEQDYFVDGMVEDILTTLAKIPLLFVIARNSSFTYKGKAVDVRQVGRELGVKYVVEGSVRKAGNRVRVTAQLVDCADGRHLWADRYDGDLDDVFALQDRITQEIVTALEVTLTEGEQVRVWRERSGSPLVYEKYSKGKLLYANFAKQTHHQAQQEFEQALDINPDYTPAMVFLGYTLADQGRWGWVADREAAYQAALAMAERALAVDADYGEAYTIISYARVFQRRHDDAVEAAERTIALSPNNATAYHMSAMAHIYNGNFRLGADYEEQASRLSPIDFDVSVIDLARARFHQGAFTEARDLAARVLAARPRWLTAQTILLAALWRLGKQDEARGQADAIRAVYANFSVNRWSQGHPYRRPEDLAALMDPLREAGLPD